MRFGENRFVFFIVLGWWLRLWHKLMDLVGIAEITEMIWILLKWNSRKMTALEITEARRIFGDTINYDAIIIDEKSLIARIGAWLNNTRHMGVSLFHTINFTRTIHPESGNRDMAWLIHELVHVVQFNQVGSQYTSEAVYAQLTDGYDYGGPDGLCSCNYKDFNREQQGDIVKDYYYHVLFDRPHRRFGELCYEHYAPVIDEMRAGRV